MSLTAFTTHFCCTMLAAACAAPPMGQDDIPAKVEGLLKQMTLQEKIDMCHGGSSFATAAIPRLGIRSWVMDDGPGGVRTGGSDKSTYFPTGVSLASTWDPELIYQTGQAMGQEARFFNLDVLLGPAVNIIRTPLGGRSFEYMSEDPFLAGRMAVPYIQGLQSQGVAACIKHFAANSQEIDRGFIDAEVGERALQEIYLPAFKAGITEGKAISIMDAYNKVQGVYCTANSHLQRDILEKEWGFEGVIMSDWGATHDTVGAAMGGLDLEMPGGGPDDFMAQPLLKAVQAGTVPEAVIDDKVRRILRAIFLTDLNKPNGKAEANSPAHQALARHIAENAITLLKNEKDTLPIDASRVKSIAVIGPWATALHGGSGGSSAVYPPYEITALAGIQKRAGSIPVKYAMGTGFGMERMQTVPSSALHPDATSSVNGLKAEYFDNKDLQGSPKVTRTDAQVGFRWTGSGPVEGFGADNFSVRWTGVFVPPADGEYQLGTTSDDGSRIYLDGKILVDSWGDHAMETSAATVKLKGGQAHAIRIEYYQAAGEAEMYFGWMPPTKHERTGIDAAADLARHSDVAIVLVGTNHRWDTEGSDKPTMQLMDDQAGLVQAVVAANPHTIVVLINGSPVDVSTWVGKAPAIVEAWYPGMEGGNAIASVLFGDVNPSGKLPTTFPVKLSDSPAHANGDYPGAGGKLKYDEGIYVGYRYFDTKNVKPQFPFGFGLSYTTFRFSNMQVWWSSAETPSITVDVTNTGKRPGAEVAELYVHEHNPAIDRPEKELKGFKKVFLQPGETQKVTIELGKDSFSYFNPTTRQWTFDPAKFDLLVGDSSRDIKVRRTISYPGELPK